MVDEFQWWYDKATISANELVVDKYNVPLVIAIDYSALTRRHSFTRSCNFETMNPYDIIDYT